MVELKTYFLRALTSRKHLTLQEKICISQDPVRKTGTNLSISNKGGLIQGTVYTGNEGLRRQSI